jgi:hypothetical protein
MIYILYHKGRPLFFSPNRKDLIDYCLADGIDSTNIIELPLVPNLKELAQDQKNTQEWARRLNYLR